MFAISHYISLDDKLAKSGMIPINIACRSLVICRLRGEAAGFSHKAPFSPRNGWRREPCVGVYVLPPLLRLP